jgi:hypothetical protein
VTRLGLAVAFAVALACSGASGVAAQAPPYDSLPFAPPGALPGRIVYQTADGCEFHAYDLRTTTDKRLANVQCNYGVVLSWDGRLAASRGLRDRVQVFDVGSGRRLWVGPVVPEARSRSFSYPLFFSPDSTRLAYCVAGTGGVSTIVADAGTGTVRGRVRGTCAVAYTRRGLAVVRRGRVVLGSHVLYQPPHGTRLAPGVGAAIASNPGGSLLAVALRPSRQTLELVVVDLAGRVRGRFNGTVRIPLSPQRLAPDGRSAVVWWGCILQLAPFDRARRRFKLLYGSDSEPITYPAYSAGGRYAAMARVAISLAPSEPPTPPAAVVFDGRTFAPLFRLPFAAMSIAWVRE